MNCSIINTQLVAYKQDILRPYHTENRYQLIYFLQSLDVRQSGKCLQPLHRSPALDIGTRTRGEILSQGCNKHLVTLEMFANINILMSRTPLSSRMTELTRLTRLIN